jgi:hypothetical protein
MANKMDESRKKTLEDAVRRDAGKPGMRRVGSSGASFPKLKSSKEANEGISDKWTAKAFVKKAKGGMVKKGKKC